MVCESAEGGICIYEKSLQSESGYKIQPVSGGGGPDRLLHQEPGSHAGIPEASGGPRAILVRDHTPYGRDVEPNVPEKEKVTEDFRRLSGIVGPDSMGWRYDPVMVTEVYTEERHLADFERMAEELAGATRTCVISFIDLYSKVQRNFPQAREVSQQDRLTLGREMIRIAKKYDMTVRTCAEGQELAKYGADCSGCMTQAVFENALHCRLDVPKNKSQRPECSCLLGKDIGQYDTCGHLCRYCYANSNAGAVRRNMELHNPHSPLLVGELREDNVVHEAKQASWRNGQLSLFE